MRDLDRSRGGDLSVTLADAPTEVLAGKADLGFDGLGDGGGRYGDDCDQASKDGQATVKIQVTTGHHALNFI